MSDKRDIPVLTDLIEKGPEIEISELGLDDGAQKPSRDSTLARENITEAKFLVDGQGQDDLQLQQQIRRILDRHIELACQEIALAIKRDRAR